MLVINEQVCILGIDINNLIYDLSYGIRLPAPKYCPYAISNMIRNCFHEDPDKRLDFKATKAILSLGFSEITSKTNAFPVSSNSTKINPNECVINKIEDSTMKLRYANILKKSDNKDESTRCSSCSSSSSTHSSDNCENNFKDKYKFISRTRYTILGNKKELPSSKEIVIDVHAECKTASQYEGITLGKRASLHEKTHSTNLEQPKTFHTFPRYVKNTLET